MKTAVLTYVSILALSGLVALSVLGAVLLQKEDPRGIAVLALVVGGLLMTFILAVIQGVKAKPGKVTAHEAAFNTVTTSATAEYPHSASAVWSLIKPAESATLLSENVIQAVSVPGLPDGPGERQCFFLRNGQIEVIEVVEEIPGRMAVTQALFPPSPVSQRTTYRLDATAAGCRLTVEDCVEVPVDISIDQEATQDHRKTFLARVGELLDACSARDAGPSV
ncbi:hypothetical protein LRQ04_07270 [Paenarthrobacter sp. AR 02]|uniref:hypothetical protein n=1 Tax=Paenarthrobacter sp. AR 02 TaxID=2899821 RepID=UPI001F1BE324|nr:hypothetical protein [Paenarthrobacter sp. AR 02]MCF3139055.1 hypothetical protein [Paenarthrobacter sp. AR 02]